MKLAEDNKDVGRMLIVFNVLVPVALVTYEPADGEFYTQHFTHSDLVQVPSWTWHEVTEADDKIEEIVR